MFSSLIVLLCETSHAPNHQPRFCCKPYEHCEHHQRPAIRQGQWGYPERDVRSVASHFQGLGQSWSALGNWLDTSCKYHFSLENALHKIAALFNHKRFNRRPRVTGRLRRKLLSRGKRNRHTSKFVTAKSCFLARFRLSLYPIKNLAITTILLIL